MTNTSPAADNGNDLWTYCLALYAEPGIASACIMLQDRYGVDVNLVLYASWAAGRRPNALTDQDFIPLIAATDTWQRHVTSTIRQARRALKSEAEPLSDEAYQDLRRHLLDAELGAEKIEIDRLFALSPLENVEAAAIDVRERAERNIRAYLTHLGITPDADAATAVATIAAAAGELQDRACD